MGKQLSRLLEGYNIQQKEAALEITATWDGDTFHIKIFNLNKLSKEKIKDLTSEIEIFKQINHSHIVTVGNSFQAPNGTIYYLVKDHSPKRNLMTKIKQVPKESQILSWIVEICMALKVLHEAGLCHKDLMPKNVFFTESGLVVLDGFGNLNKNLESETNLTSNATLSYLAPEVVTDGTYDAKSDVWSVGCILYELCTKKQAFSARNANSLIPKIISGASPRLPNGFSQALHDLLNDLLKNDPKERPTTSEILVRPIVIRCLMTKTKKTVADLHTKVESLRGLTICLENIHEGATIGSLSGHVIKTVGGITTMVGVLLAPLSFGTSLALTGVGAGVGVIGGLTTGASKIPKKFNQQIIKVVRSTIKEIEQKISAVVTWLEEILNSLPPIRRCCHQTLDSVRNREKNLKKLDFKAGKGSSDNDDLAALVNWLDIAMIIAKIFGASKEITDSFSFLSVVVECSFIVEDAEEIHNIKEAKEVKRQRNTSDMSETKDQSAPDKSEIKSGIMRFALSVSEAADDLEEVLNQLKTVISSIPMFSEEN